MRLFWLSRRRGDLCLRDGDLENEMYNDSVICISMM